MNCRIIITIISIAILAGLDVFAKDVAVDSLAGAKAVSSTPAELIRGEISGVRVSAVDGGPNGHFNVNIRGVNTLRGDSQPLWIVDGAVIGSSVNQNMNAFYLHGGKTINGAVLPDYSGKSYVSPLGNFRWLNLNEIESVEVLKDISATSLYGMAGANGVIIIKTKQPHSGDSNIRLNSNVGLDLSALKGEAFKTGLITTHDLGASGVFGTNSFYNISGFVRYADAAVLNNNSTAGGVTINVNTTANEILQFGLNSRLSYGEYVTSAGVNYIGQPSAMILSRYPDAFPKDKLDAWLNSYADETIDYRTVNSVWLGINLLRTLKLKLSTGVDYQNQSRFIWHGSSTSFGKDFKGAIGILNNSLLTYNFKGELAFDRSFAVRHHLTADLVFDINGNANMTNAMCGTNFDLPQLRGKGLSSSSSIHAIMKFDRMYSRLGGYARLGYDYDAYAGISGGLRGDHTTRYDESTMLLPFAEAYIDLKKMLLPSGNKVSTFKFSGGYGWAGSEMALPYEYINAFVRDVPMVDKGSEPYFDGFNRLLSKEMNVGLSMGFVSDRFCFGLKYYDKSTDDSFKIFNFGKVLAGLWVETDNYQIFHQRHSSIINRGFEFDTDLLLVQGRNVNLKARANVAYSISRAMQLDVADRQYADVSNGSYVQENEEGMTLGLAFGYNTIPLVYGGFGTTLSLLGFDVDAHFSGAAGFNVINANNLVEKGLNYISTEDIERGDYLRLDCLTVSYSVPLRSKAIKSLRVNVSAHNLFTLTGYSGWNPDVNCFGVNAGAYGVDYGSYPLRRQIVLGVGLKF